MTHTNNKIINFGKETKICIMCSIPLERKEAGTSLGNCYASNYDRKKYRCNSCSTQYQLKNQKRWRKQKTVGSSQHIRDMLESARKRAKKNNVDYSLKAKDLRNLMTESCPILGIKFELNKPNQKWGKSKGKNNWQTSPSLDRIIPSKGYVKDNVIIVSLMANSIKNQATPDQILTVGKYYKKLYKEKGINYV